INCLFSFPPPFVSGVVRCAASAVVLLRIKSSALAWVLPRKAAREGTRMASYTPKNILITGAAGFIASHVANRLVRNYPDYKVVVLDKLDYCSNLKNLHPSLCSPNFKFVK
ncbi:unnamed protein product, partial [Musa banksii]